MSEKRFAEFAKTHVPLAGRKLKIAEVFDREIVVIGYRVGPSKYHATNPYMRLQFTLNDELCILCTGSAVLIEQVETYREELPFAAIIKQVDRFFTFT